MKPGQMKSLALATRPDFVKRLQQKIADIEAALERRGENQHLIKSL